MGVFRGVMTLQQPDLVMRAMGGDVEAFAALVERHERMALSVAYGCCNRADIAADAVQEAMIRAWTRLPSLREPERFAAWLANIVRNVAMDQGRRKKPTLGEAALAAHAAHDADPSEASHQREEQARLQQALEQLDDVTRSAVTLRYYEDLSSKQIADLLGLSPAAVDMRLSRARQELRRLLEHDRTIRP